MRSHLLPALKDAFPHTIPIMLGYIFMGMAFGILLQKEAGYGALWALMMSIIIYGGATQFISVGLIAGGVGLWESFVIVSMINARQIFYSISMLEHFKQMGKLRYYMIYSLTDETLALLNLKTPKQGINKSYFEFFISFLNQIYWIVGCVLGALVGSSVDFNPQGLDFMMGAIFIVIFIEQWRKKSMRKSALIGIGVSLICLYIFGAQHFLIPSLIGICLSLMLCRKPMEKALES
ncbi:branched-chain amino acid ABC transporter permease [Helicobacter jaachi]|uniref:Branched-chain amino acid ABC transporter permease n=1 Tax=Helicobacter jaachi TaxID=1677920 RepID=A0A4U8TDD7_9HELI|nr:AzlC family ABC transporter permease [Helicobacter jaachi]TLD97298.1 branched-chain amino acid ABC transporter permease [Helicobacter jaachi]